MKSLLNVAFAIVIGASAFAASAQDKVVYHFDSGLAQAAKGLRNIRNHLDIDSTATIIAVAHAEGRRFLMEGAKTANNQEFAALVADLEARGVKFEICEITLKNRNLKRNSSSSAPPSLRRAWCASRTCRRESTTHTSSPDRRDEDSRPMTTAAC